ncbi:MAG: LPS export ABC transporter periplasmic protein LptC [Lentisphaerae bacterium]|nr:LPS export ABC transporter periplasmic protein LptC [Lentisphaerota bacterium]
MNAPGRAAAHWPPFGSRRVQTWLLVVLFLTVGLMAGRGEAQTTGAPIRNLRIPLELYPDGKVKMQITAGTATLAENGNIEATEVKIEMYGPAGEVEGHAEVGSCHVDRENQVVTSEAVVHIVQKGLTISGTGFEWHASDQSFRILDQARVEFPRDQSVNFWKRP